MHRLIPIKNRVFETEKSFLEKRHRQGFALMKRGWFLYHFTPVNPGEAQYEIDLLPKDMADDELKVEGWEVVQVAPIFYKGLKKVYYLSLNVDDRLIVDEALCLDYYKQQISIWAFFAIISLFLALILEFSPFLFIPCILLFIYSVISAVTFNRARKILGENLGEDAILDRESFAGVFSYRLVHFSGLTLEQKVEIEEIMPTLGRVVRKSMAKDHYYLKTSIPLLKDLKQEIVSATTVQAENITIARGGAGSFFGD